MTSIGMFSAARESAGSASGTSTTSSWPTRTLYAGSTAAPLTSTRPSFASREMALRESRLCSARKRSTRCPPSTTRSAIRSATRLISGFAGDALRADHASLRSANGGPCPLAPHGKAARRSTRPKLSRLRRWGAVLLVPERHGDQNDPDDDRRVSDVEGPEANVADPHVDEVDDVSLGDPVEQIPERAAELHPERCRDERRVARDLAVVVNDREDRDDGEHRKKRCALRQETERGARVLRVDDPHVVADDRAGRAERNVLADPSFGHAVDHEDQNCDARDEKDPRGSHA